MRTRTERERPSHRSSCRHPISQRAEFPAAVVCGLGPPSELVTARLLTYAGIVLAIDDLTVVVGKDSRFADFVHKLVTRALIDSFGERSQVWQS